MDENGSAYRVAQRDHQDWEVWRAGEAEPVSRGFATQHAAIDYASGRAEHDRVELVIEDGDGGVVEVRPPPGG